MEWSIVGDKIILWYVVISIYWRWIYISCCLFIHIMCSWKVFSITFFVWTWVNRTYSEYSTFSRSLPLKVFYPCSYKSQWSRTEVYPKCWCSFRNHVVTWAFTSGYASCEDELIEHVLLVIVTLKSCHKYMFSFIGILLTQKILTLSHH